MNKRSLVKRQGLVNTWRFMFLTRWEKTELVFLPSAVAALSAVWLPPHVTFLHHISRSVVTQLACLCPNWSSQSALLHMAFTSIFAIGYVCISSSLKKQGQLSRRTLTSHTSSHSYEWALQIDQWCGKSWYKISVGNRADMLLRLQKFSQINSSREELPMLDIWVCLRLCVLLLFLLQLSWIHKHHFAENCL